MAFRLPPWKKQVTFRHSSLSLGNLPVSEIQPSDILFALKRIEAKGNLETARRTLQFASRVFCYAVATTRLTSYATRKYRVVR